MTSTDQIENLARAASIVGKYGSLSTSTIDRSLELNIAEAHQADYIRSLTAGTDTFAQATAYHQRFARVLSRMADYHAETAN